MAVQNGRYKYVVGYKKMLLDQNEKITNISDNVDSDDDLKNWPLH